MRQLRRLYIDFSRDKNGTKNMIIMSNTKKRVIDNEPFVNGYINKQFQSPRLVEMKELSIKLNSFFFCILTDY